MIEDPKVNNTPDHWAMTLGRLFFQDGQDWMLDVYQILDVQSGGAIQWRRKDFTIEELERWSSSPMDYVMDSQPYSRREMSIVQERDLTRKMRGEESEIRWSCKSHNLDSLAPLWPDFEEEHV